MRQNKKSRSLSITLSVSFLSLILTSLLISGTIGTFFSFQSQQNIVFSEQQLIAQNAANMVTGFIQDKFSAMETTARLINPIITTLDEQDKILSHLLGPHYAFRQLVLLNSKNQKTLGISRLSREGSSELDDIFRNDLFTQASQGKKYISPVYVDKVTSEPMIIMSVPVNDALGDFQGVLIAEVNLKFMWDLVEGIKIGRKGLAYVVDKQGKLIAYSDIARVLKGENISKLNSVREFVNGSVSSNEVKAKVFRGINGVIVLGTYVSLGVPDWAVVTELPVLEAYQLVIHTIVITIVFTFIMAALAGWIGIYLARRLSMPLVNLMKIVSRISDGEIELQAEVKGPTEIANLAIAFNSMTAQLREVIGNLEQRSRYLQKTVQRYVKYMSEVGKGKLDSRLAIKNQKDKMDDPLAMLGRQLNDTTANLQWMIEQIRDTSTKLKQHEEKLLIYSDKLKKSNHELEQFAYVASHDLQEPLRKIQFFGNRLKTNYSSILDEKAIEYIDRMNNDALRMENFIKNLLQYSRVTIKAKPFEPVDLNEVVKEVIGDLEIRINETKAEIKTEKLPMIDADPFQMRQLFQNIIGNSIKYHKQDVTPRINVNCKIVSIEDNNNLCEINIIDNGIGFDNKYSEQIFGLFQRLHGHSEYEGTGIGLSICKKIVERHSGIIMAFSKKDEGSTFSIQLPLKQKKNE